MSDLAIITLSGAMVLLLIPVFIIAKRHGKRNIAALRVEVDRAIREAREEVDCIPGGDYRIAEIGRFLNTWHVKVDFQGGQCIQMDLKGLGGHRFEIRDFELYRIKQDQRMDSASSDSETKERT